MISELWQKSFQASVTWSVEKTSTNTETPRRSAIFRTDTQVWVKRHRTHSYISAKEAVSLNRWEALAGPGAAVRPIGGYSLESSSHRLTLVYCLHISMAFNYNIYTIVIHIHMCIYVAYYLHNMSIDLTAALECSMTSESRCFFI